MIGLKQKLLLRQWRFIIFPYLSGLILVRYVFDHHKAGLSTSSLTAFEGFLSECFFPERNEWLTEICHRENQLVSKESPKEVNPPLRVLFKWMSLNLARHCLGAQDGTNGRSWEG